MMGQAENAARKAGEISLKAMNAFSEVADNLKAARRHERRWSPLAHIERERERYVMAVITASLSMLANSPCLFIPQAARAKLARIR